MIAPVSHAFSRPSPKIVSQGEALRDISYGSNSAQTMDVYLPKKAVNAPILVMVHGGAWKLGDKGAAAVIDNKRAYWGQKGYIVISVNYRLLPAADPLQQAQDVASALTSIQRKAASWGGNSRRIVLMGHSAGAHLVALLSANSARFGLSPWLATVSLDSAAMDVPRIMQAPHLRFYDDAFGSKPSYWTTVSPIDSMQKKPLPMLLVCSTYRAVSCMQARQFARKAVMMGGQASVLPMPLSHAQINREVGINTDYTRQIDSFLQAQGLP